MEAFVGQVARRRARARRRAGLPGPAPAQALREEALRRGLRLRSFIEFQGLLDLTGYVADQTARLRADRRYPPELYVPQRFRELDRPASGVKDGPHRRAAAAADRRPRAVPAGARRLRAGQDIRPARAGPADPDGDCPHLVPILIELRALDKAHSVDGAGRGAPGQPRRGRHRPEGLPLHAAAGPDRAAVRRVRRAGHPGDLRAGRRPPGDAAAGRRGQGEDHRGQPHPALQVAAPRCSPRWARGWAPAAAAGAQRRGLHPGPGPRLPRQPLRRRRARPPTDRIGCSATSRTCSGSPRTRACSASSPTCPSSGCARSPRRQAHHQRGELYQEILDSWLAFEEHRVSGVPGTPAGLSREELWQAVTRWRCGCGRAGEAYLRPAELAEVAETLAGLADGRLSAGQTAHAVGTGSLMVRTEEGLFGFIHSSVMEWLVARHIAATSQPRDPARSPAAVPAHGGVPVRPGRRARLPGLGRASARRPPARTTSPGPTPSRSPPGCAPRR